MSYRCYLYLFVYSGVQHVLAIQVTWLLAYKRQELLNLLEHLGSHPVSWWRLSFLVFCVVFWLFCFVLFVFVMRLVWPMLPVSLDCPFLVVLSVFSNAYLYTVISYLG